MEGNADSDLTIRFWSTYYVTGSGLCVAMTTLCIEGYEPGLVTEKGQFRYHKKIIKAGGFEPSSSDCRCTHYFTTSNL